MAKGYWIAHVDVNNQEGYKAYAAANPGIFKKYGARFVVRAGKFESTEGASRARNIVIEFPDYATALACYNSPEYQANIKVRQPHSTVDLIIIEGYDGPQPQRSPSAPPESAKKGYWVAQVDVTDPQGYKAYMTADMEPFGKFGGRFLVRGGLREVPEGKVRSRTVALEFPSFEAALDSYRSADYQAAKKLRDGKADFDLIIVEGYDGPQP